MAATGRGLLRDQAIVPWSGWPQMLQQAMRRALLCGRWTRGKARREGPTRSCCGHLRLHTAALTQLRRRPLVECVSVSECRLNEPMQPHKAATGPALRTDHSVEPSPEWPQMLRGNALRFSAPIGRERALCEGTISSCYGLAAAGLSASGKSLSPRPNGRRKKPQRIPGVAVIRARGRGLGPREVRVPLRPSAATSAR